MNVFHYDSPISQLLMKIADLAILNILYILSCIPIFTIGAAQAGLYTAAKVMLDKKDDSSLTAAFFRGFKAGFGTITAGWGVMTLILAVFVYFAIMAVMLGMPVWMFLIAFGVMAVYQSLFPAFHSRFGCTFKQLFRNCVFLLLYYPFQSIANGLLIWLPVVLFAILDLYVFMALTPIWLVFYFSTAVLFGYQLLKEPFGKLVSHFNETHGIEETVHPEDME